MAEEQKKETTNNNAAVLIEFIHGEKGLKMEIKVCDGDRYGRQLDRPCDGGSNQDDCHVARRGGDKMNVDNTLKPCPFCGGRAILDATLTEAVIVCAGCGTLGPSACTQKEAEDAWNARREATMPIAEFSAKHSHLLGMIENCAGREKAALMVCLETTTPPMARVHQVKIYGADPELNKDVDELLAYCMTWLDDSKGIKA
ncbi:MAG: Lar family restriction alleviation protein [Terrimicrobiaceae bacterium]